MHLFRNMIPDETETLQQRWNTTCQTSGLELYDTPPTGVVDGLLPLLCEDYLFITLRKQLVHLIRLLHLKHIVVHYLPQRTQLI